MFEIRSRASCKRARVAVEIGAGSGLKATEALSRICSKC